MDKIVAYCGTRNVYPIMEVAAKSLLMNTSVDKVYFMIEDDVYPNKLPDIISTRNVSNQNWFDQNGENYNSPWTYMAFLRIAFAKIFPEYSQILYLDTDTLVLQDISDVFNTELRDNLFGMVREDIGDIPLELCKAFSLTESGIVGFQSDNARPFYPVRPYYNSGVMLINLDELYATGMDDKLIHEINTVNYPYPDQDAINLLCKDKILPLPHDCNVISSITPDFQQDQIRIKHFASDKPLWKSSLWQQYKRLSWDVVMERQAKLHE